MTYQRRRLFQYRSLSCASWFRLESELFWHVYIPIKAEDKDLYPDFPFTFSSKYSIELDLLRSKHKTLTELKWQLKILICDDKSSQFKCKIVNPIELSDIQRELMKFTIFNIENSIFLRKEGN